MSQLTNSEIRQTMTAFNVTSRLYSSDGIPLKVSRIIKALRMANRIMSIKCVQVWIEKYGPYLTYNQKSIYEGQIADKDDKIKPILYPHEFLILVAQAKNNMKTLNNVISDIMETKLNNVNVNETLKKAEINGFEKFITNEVRTTIDSEIPEKNQIRCPDRLRLKAVNSRYFDGFKLLDDWQNEMLNHKHFKSHPLKYQEIAYEESQKNKDLAMKYIVGEQAAKVKKEVDDKCDAIKSLYSLCGERPPFISKEEYTRDDLKPQTPRYSPMVHFSNTRSTASFRIRSGINTTTNKKKQKINFIEKNKDLEKCHPLNKQKFLTLKNFKSSRPGTAITNIRKASYTTATTRCELISRMGSIFDEEVQSAMHNNIMTPSPSTFNI